MTRLHWLMLLAVGLAVSPRLGLAVVRAQERSQEMAYTTGNLLFALTITGKGLDYCSEDLRVALWAIERLKKRRRK